MHFKCIAISQECHIRGVRYRNLDKWFCKYFLFLCSSMHKITLQIIRVNLLIYSEICLWRSRLPIKAMLCSISSSKQITEKPGFSSPLACLLTLLGVGCCQFISMETNFEKANMKFKYFRSPSKCFTLISLCKNSTISACPNWSVGEFGGTPWACLFVYQHFTTVLFILWCSKNNLECYTVWWERFINYKTKNSKFGLRNLAKKVQNFIYIQNKYLFY